MHVEWIEMWSSLQVFKQKLWEVDKYLIHSGISLIVAVFLCFVSIKKASTPAEPRVFFQIAHQNDKTSIPIQPPPGKIMCFKEIDPGLSPKSHHLELCIEPHIGPMEKKHHHHTGWTGAWRDHLVVPQSHLPRRWIEFPKVKATIEGRKSSSYGKSYVIVITFC